MTTIIFVSVLPPKVLHLQNERGRGVVLGVFVLSSEIVIMKRGQFFFIPLEDIYYSERLDQNTNINCKNNIISVRIPLKKIEEMLPNNFVRSHRSFIINKTLLRELIKQDENNYEAYFSNMDKTALVSKMYFDKIFSEEIFSN